MNSPLRTILFLTAAVIATSGMAQPAPTCSPPILFVNERGGQADIYVTDADGTPPTQLTDDEISERLPVWSPDGLRIAYQGYPDQTTPAEIYVIDADGTGQVNLTNNPGEDWSPAWSPDGERIAFFSTRPEGAALYVIRADGSALTMLPVTEYGAAPDWSPDGTRIAYRKELPRNDEIYVIDADGGNPINLTQHRANDYAPDWSPDGTRIVFESIRDGNYEIYSFNPDGTDLRRLTENALDDQSPRWSPDGMTILYTHHGELYVMDADGAEQRPLSAGRPIAGNWASWGRCG